MSSMSSKRFIQLSVLAGAVGLLACASIDGPAYEGNDGRTIGPPVETDLDSNSTLFSEVRSR